MLRLFRYLALSALCSITLALIAALAGCSGNNGSNSTNILTNTLPSASFSAASPGGKEVTFNPASSSDADGTIVSYAWDFGDGSAVKTLKTSAPTSHTFSDINNKYTVRLVVTDNLGGKGSFSSSISVGEIFGHDDNSTYTISGTIYATEESRVDVDVNNSHASNFENDDILNAQFVAVPMTLGGWAKSTSDRSDFYKITTNVPIGILLKIADSTSSDQDIYLYDENQAILDSSTTGFGDNESLSITSQQITASASDIF